jgi:hypothetical protein
MDTFVDGNTRRVSGITLSMDTFVDGDTRRVSGITLSMDTFVDGNSRRGHSSSSFDYPMYVL